MIIPENIIPSVFAINAVAALVAGSLVYFAGKKKAQNSVWLVYNILVSLWNFSLFKAITQKELSLATYWFRVSLCSLIFIVPLFLHFLSIYSDREVFKRKIIRYLYLLFFLLFVAFFSIPKEFIKDIVSASYFNRMIVPGLAFGIFAIIFVGFVFCGFYYLLCSEKAYLNLRRNQRLWLFLGMFLGILGPFNFFFAAYGMTFFPYGLFANIIYLGIVSFVILKYHVPEMSDVVNKLVVLAYITGFIVVLQLAAVYLIHNVMGIEYLQASLISGCVILLNLLFTVHYGGIARLNKLTKNIVYEKRQAYYKFLEDFNSILGKVKDLNTLMYYTLDSVVRIVGIDCASLYLLEEKEAAFKLTVYRGMRSETAEEVKRIPLASPFVSFLKEGSIFTMDENKGAMQDRNMAEAKKVFEKFNANLTIPLYYSMPLHHARDMVGFLNLGNKKDRTHYTKEDVDILNAFGRQLGVCINQAKLFSRAIKDDLTGLYRFDYFHRRIDEELERSKRYGRVFSVVIVDIDDFKKVNDSFGHQVGDEVLRRTADVLRSSLRKVDITARYGGEELGLLLPETDRENAHIACERVRKNIEEEFGNAGNVKQILKGSLSDKEPFRVTVSIGLSTYRPGIGTEGLIKQADGALYKAKHEGKNRVCIET